MNLNDQKVVQKDMDFLYLGNLKTVTFNLALPAKGKYGSEINWSSGEERFLDTERRGRDPDTSGECILQGSGTDA